MLSGVFEAMPNSTPCSGATMAHSVSAATGTVAGAGHRTAEGGVGVGLGRGRRGCKAVPRHYHADRAGAGVPSSPMRIGCVATLRSL